MNCQIPSGRWPFGKQTREEHQSKMNCSGIATEGWCFEHIFQKMTDTLFWKRVLDESLKITQIDLIYSQNKINLTQVLD